MLIHRGAPQSSTYTRRLPSNGGRVEPFLGTQAKGVPMYQYVLRGIVWSPLMQRRMVDSTSWVCSLLLWQTGVARSTLLRSQVTPNANANCMRHTLTGLFRKQLICTSLSRCACCELRYFNACEVQADTANVTGGEGGRKIVEPASDVVQQSANYFLSELRSSYWEDKPQG